MQETILYGLQKIATPALDRMAEYVTMFGEETFVLCIALYILWNRDKKKGFLSTSCLLFAMSCASILKAIVRFPRPFQVLPGLDGKRVETATGYSFPSGHSTIAASFYGSLFRLYPYPFTRFLCVLLIVLVGLSRLYLGVHWPVDVLCGWILGLGVSVFLGRLLEMMDEKQLARYTLVIGSLFFAAGLLLFVLLARHVVDETAYGDMAKVFVLFGSLYLGWTLDARHPFSSQGDDRRKVLRYLIGIAGVVLVQSLKLAFPSSLYWPGAALRYTLLGFWSIWFWPQLGMKLGLFASA